MNAKTTVSLDQYSLLLVAVPLISIFTIAAGQEYSELSI